MAKKKTRKQKILADKRHILYHLETSSAEESEHLEKKIKVDLPSVLPTYQAQTRSFQALPYAYIVKDIRKTAFITFSIILAQFILLFVLNRI